VKHSAFNGRYVRTGEGVALKADYLLCFPSGEPVGVDVENGNLPCTTGDDRPIGLWPSREEVEEYRDAMAQYETLTVHRVIGIAYIALGQDSG
jgi:hypothetical protein